jgi:hypothetical protein
MIDTNIQGFARLDATAETIGKHPGKNGPENKKLG